MSDEHNPTSVEPSQASTSPVESTATSPFSIVEEPHRREANDSARLQSLIRILGGLGILLLLGIIVPSFAGRIQYSLTEAEERAKLTVARENLHEFGLDQLATAYRLLAQSMEPSVVSIRSTRGRGQQQGSGVIVDADGYIITNNHVVRGVSSVEIELSDGRRGSASVVGVDPDFDLAVLKTELENLIPAVWGDSDELQVGEPVWAFGSPFGLQKSITAGIVSATKRRGITPGPYSEFLQTDAAVNPGNSGGPLVNSRGEVIGINTAIIGEGFRGVSFAIPSNLTHETYEALRHDGYVERGFLGVQPAEVPDRLARSLGLERGQGVLVYSRSNNTPAADAGIEVDDVILKWNGEEFTDPTLLSRAIAATPIGSTVPVNVLRSADGNKKEITLKVTVGARPRR